MAIEMLNQQLRIHFCTIWFILYFLNFYKDKLIDIKSNVFFFVLFCFVFCCFFVLFCKAWFWCGNRAIMVGKHHYASKYTENTVSGSKIEQAMQKYLFAPFKIVFLLFFFILIFLFFGKWKKSLGSGGLS